MDHLKEDMSVFGMKFEGWRKAAQKAGKMKFEGWRKAAQKASKWFRRVEEGAGLNMWNWHQPERHKAAERRAKAAAAPSIVGISKRPGGEEGKGGGGGRGEGGKGRGGTGGRPAQETEVWVWPSSS